MKAQWWSCVLGLLCMPAEVLLSTWTVSQDPMSMSRMRVNSSAEITCSTSSSDPMGLNLQRRFHSKPDVVYLDLKNRRVIKNTTAPKFKGRIHVAADQHIGEGCGFTLQLSLLGLEETDLYYCTWSFMSETSPFQKISSNGTIIIVTDGDPQEQCSQHILDFILIVFSATAFTIIVFLLIGFWILRCKRFKKRFRPVGAVKPPRPDRPQHVCPQQRAQHHPYLITSENTLDFRGIL